MGNADVVAPEDVAADADAVAAAAAVAKPLTAGDVDEPDTRTDVDALLFLKT